MHIKMFVFFKARLELWNTVYSPQKVKQKVLFMLYQKYFIMRNWTEMFTSTMGQWIHNLSPDDVKGHPRNSLFVFPRERNRCFPLLLTSSLVLSTQYKRKRDKRKQFSPAAEFAQFFPSFCRRDVNAGNRDRARNTFWDTRGLLSLDREGPELNADWPLYRLFPTNWRQC